MQQYEATPSAKSTVVTRYERSLAIVDAMLEAVDDEPGLNE
jgi:GH35 family endo-1,4-beta-xylanase